MEQLRFDRVVTGEQAGVIIFTRIVAHPDYKARLNRYTLALLHKFTLHSQKPRINTVERLARILFSATVNLLPPFLKGVNDK